MSKLFISGLLLVWMAWVPCRVAAQSAAAPPEFREILFEDFQNREAIIDLSQLLLWGGQTEVSSAFLTGSVVDDAGLTFNSIFLTEDAIGMGGYTSGSAYTSTAFDLLFESLSHQSQIVRIEFDYLSAQLSGNGESGRLGIALLHDYPAEGPQFGDVFSSEQAPFGRPAYNLRLLNGTGTTKQAYLFYGGGHDYMGEFERTGDQVWLPGFISGPGGISPGSVSDYPLGPVKICNKGVVSDAQWMHYTWLVHPEKMEVYRRSSELPVTSDELLMDMSIPYRAKTDEEIITEISQFHGVSLFQLPTLYNWFDHFVGLRFYFRSLQNGFLANVRVALSDQANHVTESVGNGSSLTEVRVYPTLVVDQMQVFTAGMSMQCDMYTTSGMLQFSREVKDETLSLAHLPAGIYLVRVTNPQTGSGKVFKIVKK